jgi:hypothetical protein
MSETMSGRMATTDVWSSAAKNTPSAASTISQVEASRFVTRSEIERTVRAG